jgi:sialic acid synthase SpsE/sugar phosphate isomerase/epimerase
MIIDKNVSKYIVFFEDSILEALKKISKNEGRIVFSVSEREELDGVLTNGDFKRWIECNGDFDVSDKVSIIVNKNYKYANVNDDHKYIIAQMGDHSCLPLVDEKKHLVAVARKTPEDTIQIGDLIISDNSPVLSIAEIGLNHNGSLSIAKKLIEKTAESGASCVKFQMRDLSSLYRTTKLNSSEDLGAQYTLSLLEKYQLKTKEMFELFDYSKKFNLIPLCTPWDHKSLMDLEDYGLQAYKVASADLTNHDLLISVSKTGKPIFVSTGMSHESEIIESVKILRENRAKYILLHCNSTYPTPFKDVNLKYLARLKQIGRCPIGYSGHERGFHVVLAAVALGAKIIEKHITLDKNMEGNDHKVSLYPSEFSEMVNQIKHVEAALGFSGTRLFSQGEMMNRSNLAKSLIINRDLPIGTIITSDMIEIKSPGRGVQPNKKKILIGKKTNRIFKKGDFVFDSDIQESKSISRNYTFKRKWGIPVRYHDYKEILKKSNPDFIEFHFSFKDLDLKIDDQFSDTYDLDFVVHSPDLFPGDHLLNLCSEDSSYRTRSINELQRVINITRSLKRFFKKSVNKTVVVASLGGFSKETFLSVDQMKRQYEIVEESLNNLDMDGVELLPQTLPPFPWYFGGQLFANLFVDADSTAEFCKKTNLRLCLDISHSKLTANYRNENFSRYLNILGPYAHHLHIADASGVDGEGLQIGDGDMDFLETSEILDKKCPLASFIPEIWQGHKNDGEGTWIALERLEGKF